MVSERHQVRQLALRKPGSLGTGLLVVAGLGVAGLIAAFYLDLDWRQLLPGKGGLRLAGEFLGDFWRPALRFQGDYAPSGVWGLPLQVGRAVLVTVAFAAAARTVGSLSCSASPRACAVVGNASPSDRARRGSPLAANRPSISAAARRIAGSRSPSDPVSNATNRTRSLVDRPNSVSTRSMIGVPAAPAEASTSLINRPRATISRPLCMLHPPDQLVPPLFNSPWCLATMRHLVTTQDGAAREERPLAYRFVSNLTGQYHRRKGL